MSVHGTASAGQNQIATVRTTWDEHQYIHLTDGTVLELTEADVEVLQLAFPSECDNCGYNPNDNPFEDSADEDDEEEDGGEPEAR